MQATIDVFCIGVQLEEPPGRAGGLAGAQRAGWDQDCQRSAGTFISGDAQRVVRRAEHRKGDPDRDKLNALALTPELGAFLRDCLDDVVTGSR